MENMFKKMDGLYTDISDFFAFDKQKYTIEEFFGDIKKFKDDFLVGCANFIIVRTTEFSQFFYAHEKKMKFREIFVFCIFLQND